MKKQAYELTYTENLVRFMTKEERKMESTFVSE